MLNKLLILILAGVLALPAGADEPQTVDLQAVDRWLQELPVEAQRGYRHLTNRAMCQPT